ncbi:hypothetical protein QOT17_014707 [Balamuthia mandrillaris]
MSFDAERAKEERRMEVEALRAIFFEEFFVEEEVRTLHLEEDEVKAFAIRINPYTASADTNHLAVDLRVEFGEEYPCTAPPKDIDLSLVKGSLSDWALADLREMLRREARALVGEAMIFALIEKLKELLQLYNEDNKLGLFAYLGDETVLQIFGLLDVHDLVSAALVNTYWHRISLDDSLWQYHTERYFGHVLQKRAPELLLEESWYEQFKSYYGRRRFHVSDGLRYTAVVMERVGTGDIWVEPFTSATKEMIAYRSSNEEPLTQLEENEEKIAKDKGDEDEGEEEKEDWAYEGGKKAWMQQFENEFVQLSPPNSLLDHYSEYFTLRLHRGRMLALKYGREPVSIGTYTFLTAKTGMLWFRQKKWLQEAINLSGRSCKWVGRILGFFCWNCKWENPYQPTSRFFHQVVGRIARGPIAVSRSHNTFFHTIREQPIRLDFISTKSNLNNNAERSASWHDLLEPPVSKEPASSSSSSSLPKAVTEYQHYILNQARHVIQQVTNSTQVKLTDEFVLTLKRPVAGMEKKLQMHCAQIIYHRINVWSYPPCPHLFTDNGC